MSPTTVIRLLLVVLFAAAFTAAQSTNATMSGIVLDPSGKAIPGADIEIVNDATGVHFPGVTNSEGIYAVPNLPPGSYRIQVSKVGFKTLIKPDIVLHTQSALRPQNLNEPCRNPWAVRCRENCQSCQLYKGPASYIRDHSVRTLFAICHSCVVALLHGSVQLNHAG